MAVQVPSVSPIRSSKPVNSVQAKRTISVRQPCWRLQAIETPWTRSKESLARADSLLVYKKGLYLVGLSHHHGEVRTFALDSFRAVEWLRGDSFQYPEGYRPEK